MSLFSSYTLSIADPLDHFFSQTAALAFHRDCVNYPEIKTLVHDFVRKNYNYDSMRGSLRKHVKEGYQKKLLGELLEPILEKLRLPS